MVTSAKPPALLFDLDGTLVDSGVPACARVAEALERAGIELSVWRIHRRIGMSGGLFVNALLSETANVVSFEQAEQAQRFHAEAYASRSIPGTAPARCTRTVGGA